MRFFDMFSVIVCILSRVVYIQVYFGVSLGFLINSRLYSRVSIIFFQIFLHLTTFYHHFFKPKKCLARNCHESVHIRVVAGLRADGGPDPLLRGAARPAAGLLGARPPLPCSASPRRTIGASAHPDHALVAARREGGSDLGMAWNIRLGPPTRLRPDSLASDKFRAGRRPPRGSNQNPLGPLLLGWTTLLTVGPRPKEW
jgi:hypothetical protein